MQTIPMLKAALKAFNVLIDDEIENFIQCFSSKNLNKSDLFVKTGETCNEIAYIKSGLFRSFYVTDKGEEVTSCLKFPGSLMTAYSSFITAHGSFVNMQAIAPAELLVVQKKVMEDLANENPNWMKFLRIIAERQYIELEKRTFQFQSDSAVQRYTALVEQHPEYIQNIPQQYLASYLGITQRHLSRIRKELHL